MRRQEQQKSGLSMMQIGPAATIAKTAGNEACSQCVSPLRPIELGAESFEGAVSLVLAAAPDLADAH